MHANVDMATSSQILAGVLKKEHDIVIVLVVGSNEFCEKLSSALIICNQQKNSPKLKVDICNRIQDIFETNMRPKVDFVVFEVDTRLRNCLEKVEEDISFLQMYLTFGHMCLVHDNYIRPMEMTVSHNQLLDLRIKYGVYLLAGTTTIENKCYYLAQRILKLLASTFIPLFDTPRVQN